MSDDEIKKIIEKLKGVKDLLEKFSTREEAIEYLVKETNLLKEECSKAYDLLIKIDFSKNIN